MDPAELVGFKEYLRVERRLADSTIAAEVTRALLDEGATRKPVSVKAFGYTLRALLRFFFVTGITGHDLSAATLVIRSPPGCPSAWVATTWKHVHCVGKGRKERATPLLPDTVKVMSAWIAERAATSTSDPLFATTTGRCLSRDAIEARLRHTSARAAGTCPSLAGKNVTAHTLRHTTAMRLLHAGVDATVIALWLGHENVTTTSIYIHADMTIKEQAIARATPRREHHGDPLPAR